MTMTTTTATSASNTSLLLLPAPPRPSTRPALNAAYRAPLTAVLTRLQQHFKSKSHSNSNSTSVLVVALACPSLLSGPSPRRKSINWPAAQSLLASLYILTCVICLERSIEIATGEQHGGVDVRILLVDHESGRRYERNFDGVYDKNNTTVLDLAAFATTTITSTTTATTTSSHPWRWVFHPSSEAGYELLSAYLTLAEGRQTFLQNQLVAVPGGLSLSTTNTTPTTPVPNHTLSNHNAKGFNTVCLGGTFDHLHPGHKLLLHASVLLLAVPEPSSGKQSVLIIGVSADQLLKNKKYAEELQSWPLRVDRVLDFLSTVFDSRPCEVTTSSPPSPSSSSSNVEEKRATFRDGAVLVRLVALNDPFGPTISEEQVDILVLSGETRRGGEAINTKRCEKGWKPLEVYEIDVLDANGTMEDINGIDHDNYNNKNQIGDKKPAETSESFAAKISSTAIRKQIAEAKGKT